MTIILFGRVPNVIFRLISIFMVCFSYFWNVNMYRRIIFLSKHIDAFYFNLIPSLRHI